MRDNTLVALDRAQAVVWTYDLTRDIQDSHSTEAVLLEPFSNWRPSQGIDVDLDGTKEIIAIVAFRSAGATPSTGSAHVVYCVSHDGKVKWRYTPRIMFTFAGTRFDGPWHVRDWIVVRGHRDVSLWVSFVHHTFWPSFVVAIDAAGSANLRFVNRGHIYRLAHVRDSHGSWVMAAGVHNDSTAAAMAVLNAEGVPAVARLTDGTALQCDTCPTGDPVGYYVFARSELNRLIAGTVNYPFNVVVTDLGAVEVSTREVSEPALRSIYRVSRFAIESVAMSDSYWEFHRRPDVEKKLGHSSSSCPERLHGVMARSWQPETGWKDVTVPIAFSPPGNRRGK